MATPQDPSTSRAPAFPHDERRPKSLTAKAHPRRMTEHLFSTLGGWHVACPRPQVGSLPPNSRFSSTAHERLVLHRRGFIAYFEIGIREEIGVSRHAAARHTEPMKKRV